MAVLIFLVIIFGAYFLPSIIAVRRHKKSAGSIIVINFVFGWTFLGWIICLAWSLG